MCACSAGSIAQGNDALSQSSGSGIVPFVTEAAVHVDVALLGDTQGQGDARMNGIGPRLREERERLGMTQRVFGDIGGVEPNAQGRYESGERMPRVDYLAAVAAKGVDALYVLNGVRTPVPLHGLSAQESDVLNALRGLAEADKAAIVHLLKRLSDHSHEQPGRIGSDPGRQSFLTKAMR